MSLAQEQSHYSRNSNCRGNDFGKAVINPGLYMQTMVTTNQHYPFYRWVGWNKVTCLSLSHNSKGRQESTV